MYVDQTLTCAACGEMFLFSAGEQEFFAAKHFQHKPSRCHDCRFLRRLQQSGLHDPDAPLGQKMSFVTRPKHSVRCAKCGKNAEVPFLPRGDRPVYCRECFEQERSALK